jgi:hypothetical protein
MSKNSSEPTFRHAPEERPGLDFGRIAKTPARRVGYRFLAGALTSVGAGVVSIVFGARVGGVFLAFPSILAASLTLIEQQEDTRDAREDARGAIIGGAAMATFALVVALVAGPLPGGVALLLAAATWLATALILYALLWLR